MTSSVVGHSDKGTRVRVMGFGRRLGAMIIDAVIVAFVSYALAFALGFVGLTINMFQPTDGEAMQPIILIATLLFSILYYVGSWAVRGATVGKTVLGMTIVNSHGGKISWGQAFLRYVGYVVSAAIFGLGFLWIAFDRRRQGLHDKIAGTFVATVDDDVPPGTTVEFVPIDPGHGWIWAVIWAIVAITGPVGLIIGWIVMGPTLSRIIMNLLGR